MACSQPSRDILRGHAQQSLSLRSPQPRHRSESRRLSRRCPRNTEARNCYHRPGTLHAGSAVRVFSISADQWVDAEVVSLMEDSYVRVEYEVGKYWCGKTVHLHSQHLEIPSALANSSCEEFDPGAPAPLMQGSNANLLDSEAAKGRYYFKIDYIMDMLTRGDVVLIKGSWLLKQFRNKSVLPRRQELPRQALWKPEDLRRRINDDVELISISHCWYTKLHPDPEGEQLRDLGPALEARLEGTSDADWWVNDLAIFWCWCSYYQEPRTEEEQMVFENTLQDMHIWYTNANAEVWMLTKVPHHVENPTKYEDRGWTTWESSVATFFRMKAKRPSHGHLDRRVLDIGALDDSHIRKQPRPWLWREVVKLCKTDDSVLPREPEQFFKLIDKKKFTKGKQDLDLVKANYQRAFADVKLEGYSSQIGGDLPPGVSLPSRLDQLKFQQCIGLQIMSGDDPWDGENVPDLFGPGKVESFFRKNGLRV